jgi:hypothetical protein
MTRTKVLRTRTRRIAASATVAAATVVGAAATAVAVTTPASAATPSAATPAACGNSSLHTTMRSAGAAMMHSGDVLVFTNVSSHACTLYGYPGAAIEYRSTPLVNATRTLNGYIGDGRDLTSPPHVTLAAGASASAVLEWVANAGEPCYANRTGTLHVTPPNTTATVALGSTLTVGQEGICSGFDIHPVVAGIVQF